ncbi:MAG: hypothetical protein MJ180_00200 [Candidatus Gastranaerophilales bacterium]|nr:hypothetical protein [Candidatus Gastranaerophilales bacterium]
MIIDHIRDLKELEKLYNNIDHSNLPKLEDIIKCGDYLFVFYPDNVSNIPLGAIYIEEKDKEYFLNGFSKRSNLENVIIAIETVCNAFKKNMYSQTPFKHARYALAQAGFEHYKDDIYIRKA